MLCIAVLAPPIVNPVMCYLDGRMGGYSIFLDWPLAWLLIIGFWLILLILRIGWTTIKRPIAWKRIVFLACLPFIGLGIGWSIWKVSPPGAYWFLLGFKPALAERISIDEIRISASIAQGILDQEGAFCSPDKGLNSDHQQQQWEEFISEAPVSALPTPFCIFYRLEAIEFVWGGALIGHWGIRVHPSVSRYESDVAFIQFQDDIALFYR